MSKRCLHKDKNGVQCDVELETGLLCEKHAVEGSKAKSRRSGGGGGPGWGPGENLKNSLLRYWSVAYHHRPPDEKD